MELSEGQRCGANSVPAKIVIEAKEKGETMMNDLLKSGYVCHPQQLYTLRRVTVSEGKAKDTQIIEVCTAGGLHLDILPDAALDIGQARYKGVNMTFISKNGYDSPAAIDPYDNGFLHTFPGGLLYTCGLRTTGGPHDDGGDWQTQHGRIHSVPAEQVCAREEDGMIVISGVMRETALFGHALEMKRTIRIPCMGAKVEISDEITNLGFRDEEWALLYHCNFGYPFVSESAHLKLPAERKTTPRTPFAATGLGKETTFDAPAPGEEERVFFHEEMQREAAIVNPYLQTQMTIRWSETLPILAHWRSMASGDYVCALEPTNCYIMGRKFERENGTLPVLKPFETRKTCVTIEFETI